MIFFHLSRGGFRRSLVDGGSCRSLSSAAMAAAIFFTIFWPSRVLNIPLSLSVPLQLFACRPLKMSLEIFPSMRPDAEKATTSRAIGALAIDAYCLFCLKPIAFLSTIAVAVLVTAATWIIFGLGQVNKSIQDYGLLYALHRDDGASLVTLVTPERSALLLLERACL